jgi:hypothetical protein
MMAGKRRGAGLLVVVCLVVIGLVGAYFIADSLLRTYAQNRVRQEIVGNLPAGITGDIEVSIGGQSVIAQYLTGRFQHIDLRAPRLEVNGAEAFVHIVASDVPVDMSKPVGDVRGAIEIGQASLNTLVTAAGAPADSAVELGEGTVAYTGSLTVLGLPLGYRATAQPEASADSIALKPISAELTTGIGSLNLTPVVEHLLNGDPLTICVAEYIPAGVNLTGVNVHPDRVRFTLHAPDLKLDSASLNARGSCPPAG